MALITLLTDSGDKDFYVSAIKARIMSTNPGIRVEDISHHVGPGNVAHAAFVLRSVFRDFPKGTVHLVGVGSASAPGAGFIAMQQEDHFFVAANNGVLSLVSDRAPQQVAEINVQVSVTTFPEKEILGPAAARLASGVSLSDLGRPCQQFRKLTGRHVKTSKKNILGHVIHVDHFGNLITNIQKQVFEDLATDRHYSIQFGGEKIPFIHSGYNDTEQGECFVLFNSIGLLEIGILNGNAGQLLGLGADSPVNILFEE